jgi:hypothetical protein
VLQVDPKDSESQSFFYKEEAEGKVRVYANEGNHFLVVGSPEKSTKSRMQNILV